MQDIGAVILAAGESSRFGRPKQLLQFRGKSLVRRIADAAGEAGCEPIAVVTGSDGEKIRAELRGARLKIFENQNWRAGIGGSIRLGVQGLIDIQPKLEAIVLLVCDQPLVDAGAVRQLIAIREKTNKAIVASGYSATLGAPALFDRSCFRELLALEYGNGAKSIILCDHERVAKFPFPKGKIDIDTLDDYEKLIGR
jgi:molybdenum cofactor cytidylyltransferase